MSCELTDCVGAVEGHDFGPWCNSCLIDLVWDLNSPHPFNPEQVPEDEVYIINGELWVKEAHLSASLEWNEMWFTPVLDCGFEAFKV